MRRQKTIFCKCFIMLYILVIMCGTPTWDVVT